MKPDKIYILSILLVMAFGFKSSAQIKPLPFDNYINKRGGLGNTSAAIAQQKYVTVAFLGGSITYNPGWRDMVCTYLKDNFPKTKFRFIAAGIPSLGSLPHAFRVQRDILDSGKVDLLFLEAAVNDQVNGTDSVTQVRSLEGIIRHANKSNPLMDIVMMSFADPDKTAIYQKGGVPTSVANHELVAGHYELPSINLAKAVSDKLANKEFDWAKDFKDLHPSPFGQQLYFEAIKALLSADLVATSSEGLKPHKHNFASVPMLNKDSFVNGSYLDINNAKYDINWTLNKSWTPADKLDVRDGFVKVPMLTADKPDASFILRFKGNAIGLAMISGADVGILTYTIDNGPEQHLDMYTQWSSFIHLPWYKLFGSGLSNGEHELKVTISGEKNPASKGNACRIVYFLVNKS